MTESALTRRLLALSDPTRLAEMQDRYGGRDHAAEARAEIEALWGRAKARGLAHPSAALKKMLSGSLELRMEACRLVASYLEPSEVGALEVDWLVFRPGID